MISLEYVGICFAYVCLFLAMAVAVGWEIVAMLKNDEE